MSRKRRLVPTLLLVAAALAVAVPIAGLAAPTDPVMPDLVADAPQRMIVSNYTYPDGTQARLLRFDGYIHNIGPGPLEIRATARSGSVMTDTRQYIRTEGGSFVRDEPPPGPPTVLFETDDAHNHWHLKNIARYSLWNAARTAEVAPGMKAGFCLEDSERRETNGPASAVYSVSSNVFCGQGQPTRPDLTMGVSAGWRDLYHRDLSFQWVDVSDTQPGTYYVAAEIDTENIIQEANEGNNTRTFAASSTAVPGYLASAVNAGTLPFGQASTVTLASQTFGSPGARRFRVVSLPAHGTLSSGGSTLAAGATFVGPGVTFTPAAGYSGPDEFTFAAYDSTSAFPRNPAAASASLVVGQAPAGTQVAISGAPPSLNIGTSAQLSATVTNGTGGVTWSVNGVAGGNATVGTISATGLYQAPASVPAGGSVTVRATSVSTPSAFAEVAIQIVNPGPPDPAPQPGTNLVANPSFETGTTGWTRWQATLTREQVTGAPNGVWAGKLTRSSGSAFTLDDSPDTVLNAVGGATYRAQAFVRAASSSSVGKRVRLQLREGTPTTILRTVGGPYVTLTNDFREITVELTPLAAGNEIEVIAAMNSGAGSGDAFYIDQISLVNATGSANTPPTASFTASAASPTVGQSVTFTDTSSDSDGTVVGREWDTDGDGAYDDGTGTTATASYASPGDVTVRLRVTDDDGATATASRTVSVQPMAPPPNTPPSASFTVSDATPAIGQSVTFTDTSTDTDGNIATRAWDTDGDGAYDDGTGTTATASYASAGDVTVRLRVTDDDGAPATTTRTVSVESGPPPPNTPPTAAFTVSNSSPAIGQSVTFTDTSTDSDGGIATRAWDTDADGAYDDGTGATAAASYPAAGIVTVGLRVTDDDGAPATTTRTVNVQPATPPPSGNLVANPSFETNLTGWAQYQATLTREALAGAPDGAYVARVTRSSGTSFTIDDSPETVASAAAGGTYTVRAWVRAATSSAVGKGVRITMREGTPTTWIRSIVGPTVTLSNTWQEVTAQISGHATGNEIDFYVAQLSAASGNAFYIDKVSLTR